MGLDAAVRDIRMDMDLSRSKAVRHRDMIDLAIRPDIWIASQCLDHAAVLVWDPAWLDVSWDKDGL
ncbi:MAG: hypothetical protein QHH07_01410 [Sedimentisphaerales bacterium]|jgi:hypothetical protein|nr:hypothetical protein [Sedimentisphaerales bacterium]